MYKKKVNVCTPRNKNYGEMTTAWIARGTWSFVRRSVWDLQVAAFIGRTISAPGCPDLCVWTWSCHCKGQHAQDCVQRGAGARQVCDHEISLPPLCSLDRQCTWPLCGTISGARNLSVMFEPDSVRWLLLRRASLLLLPFQLLRALILNHLNSSKFRISDLESPGDKSTYKPL